jgi:hypothetical protein
MSAAISFRCRVGPFDFSQDGAERHDRIHSKIACWQDGRAAGGSLTSFPERLGGLGRQCNLVRPGIPEKVIAEIVGLSEEQVSSASVWAALHNHSFG